MAASARYTLQHERILENEEKVISREAPACIDVVLAGRPKIATKALRIARMSAITRCGFAASGNPGAVEIS